jgi:hypothetical protein
MQVEILFTCPVDSLVCFIYVTYCFVHDDATLKLQCVCYPRLRYSPLPLVIAW